MPLSAVQFKSNSGLVDWARESLPREQPLRPLGKEGPGGKRTGGGNTIAPALSSLLGLLPGVGISQKPLAFLVGIFERARRVGTFCFPAIALFVLIGPIVPLVVLLKIDLGGNYRVMYDLRDRLRSLGVDVLTHVLWQASTKLLLLLCKVYSFIDSGFEM